MRFQWRCQRMLAGTLPALVAAVKLLRKREMPFQMPGEAGGRHAEATRISHVAGRSSSAEVSRT